MNIKDLFNNIKNRVRRPKKIKLKSDKPRVHKVKKFNIKKNNPFRKRANKTGKVKELKHGSKIGNIKIKNKIKVLYHRDL